MILKRKNYSKSGKKYYIITLYYNDKLEEKWKSLYIINVILLNRLYKIVMPAVGVRVGD